MGAADQHYEREDLLELAARSSPRRAGSPRANQARYSLVPLFITTDVLALSLSAALALVISQTSGSVPESALWAAATVGLVEFLFVLSRIYEHDRRQIMVSSLDEVREIFTIVTLVGFAELAVGQAFTLARIPRVGPNTVLLFWACAIATMPLLRGLLRHRIIPRLNAPQNTLIVGAGQVGQMIAKKISGHRGHNLKLVGFLDDNPHALDSKTDDLPVVGGEKDLVESIRRWGVRRVILAFSQRRPEEVLQLLRDDGLRDVGLSIVPRYFELVASDVALTDVKGIPVLNLPSPRLSRLALVTKRTFDLVVSVALILLLAPAILVIVIASKLDSRGPVLFRQRRMGSNHKAFEILKFRTMTTEAELMHDLLLPVNETAGPLFKIRDDPRVTRVGQCLRKLCLDELPQLWNVVKGDMSLVGPRPFVVNEDLRINGWARRRLDLKPGITGVWQVLGRHELGFDEMARLDYLYISNWSLWWDIKLMLRTLPIVLGRRGY